LDYENPKLDIHALMQVWKTHPFVSKFLEGGELLEYGARPFQRGGVETQFPKIIWGKTF